MKYIIKFNEISSQKILSGDRIGEIINELREISTELDENSAKCNAFTEELSGYNTQSTEDNNQIDDAFVDFKSLTDKLKQVSDLIVNINNKLENYSKEGPKAI